MNIRHPSLLPPLAGILALIGCGASEPSSTGTGGAASGGAAATGGSISANGGAATTTLGGSNGAGGTTTSGSGGSSSGGAAAGGATSGGAASGGAASGGAASGDVSGGAAAGGATSGGAAISAGGRVSMGGSAGSGGATGASGGKVGSAGSGGMSSGTCTASKAVSANVSGTGSHKVVVETNADGGISEGTIYRPADMGGTDKYPIFVWGEGGCSLNGLSNSAAMAEIASHGYFVIADGTPNNNNSRTMDSSNPAGMGKPLLAYVSWAIAENEKPCSAYYHGLDTTKVAANGFSCGGLMAEGTAGDARITTFGINSSGLFAANPTFYKTIHTPVLIVLGGSSDIAYENGKRDFQNISALGIPTLLFSKALGHGGDLFSRNGGDFTKIDLAWLNWQLKGDETATGKGLLVGASCSYCKDSAWEVLSKNIP